MSLVLYGLLLGGAENARGLSHVCIVEKVTEGFVASVCSIWLPKTSLVLQTATEGRC